MNEWTPGDNPEDLPDGVFVKNGLPLYGPNTPPSVSIAPDGTVRWPDE